MYCGACHRDAVVARGLIARGHDVTVIPLYTPLRVEGEPFPVAPVYLGGVNAYLQQHVGLFRKTPGFIDRILDVPAILKWAEGRATTVDPSKLGPMTVSVLKGSRGRQRKEFDRLTKAIVEMNPEVVSITNTLLSGVIPSIRRHTKAAIVCALQGEDSFLKAIPDEDYRKAVDIVRSNMRFVDLLIAPSENHAGRMETMLDVRRSRIKVIPVGVDSAAFGPHAARPSSPITIGYVGAITPTKGLSNLVRSVVALPEGVRANVRLRIAGRVLDKPYWESILAGARADGIGAQMEYLGEVDTAAKVDLLRRCHLFAFPSRIPESRGIAGLEAMAAGAVLVAPEYGCFPEMAAATGGAVLYDRKQQNGLGATLADLIGRGPAELERLGRIAAEGTAREYAAEATVARTEELLVNLLANRRKRKQEQEAAEADVAQPGEPDPEDL